MVFQDKNRRFRTSFRIETVLSAASVSHCLLNRSHETRNDVTFYLNVIRYGTTFNYIFATAEAYVDDKKDNYPWVGYWYGTAFCVHLTLNM